MISSEKLLLTVALNEVPKKYGFRKIYFSKRARFFSEPNFIKRMMDAVRVW
jgi:hypothetical protein